METTETVEKPKKRIVKKTVEKPLKKRGLLGIFKGKIHFDDSVFNLG